MSQIQKQILRGLLVPDRRLTLWETESGEYSAGGTRLGGLPTGGNLPGIPDPQSETELVLRATGSQAIGRRHRVRSQTGGYPDRNGASFIWREAGGTWFGWDTPNLLTGWDVIRWSSSSSTQLYQPHAVVLDDDTVLAVCTTGTIGASLTWLARNPNTGAWVEDELVAGVTDEANPCLVVLPGDTPRVLCFYWSEDLSASKANVAMRYSDDGGATWSLGAYGVLPTAISTAAGSSGYDLGRLRAAYKDGQVLLVACIRSHDTALAEEDLLVQYASADLGSNFVEVDRHDGTTGNGGNFQDLAVVDGRFVLAYLAVVDKLPRVVRLASAFDAFTAGEAVTPASGGGGASTEVWGSGSATITSGDLALFQDEAGHLYLTGRQPNVQNEWLVIRSVDGGVTWAEMGRSSGTSGCGKWWDSSDASTYPKDACAVFQRGRAIVIHGHASSPGAYTRSLSASYLGGYTSVTMPSYEAFQGDTNQVTYSTTYLPFDLPNDCGWTASGAGAGAITTGLLRITASSGQNRWYDRTPSGTVDNGAIATAIVDPTAGSFYLLVRMDDGTEGYEVEVRVTDDDIEVYDAVAATQVGSTATRTAGTEVEVRVALKGNDVVVAYRLYDTINPREWTTVATSSTLTDSAGAAGTNRIRFGTPLQLVTREIDVRMVAYVTDEGASYVGRNLTSFTNPDDLFGRPYSSAGTYLDDGVVLRASEGPTLRGDEWHVDTRYTYRHENLLPTLEPSPREVWRSAPYGELNASTDEIRLAWRIDGDGSGDFLVADCALDNDVLGLWLDDVNCAELRVDLYYGGAWVNVATTDVHKFAGVRQGNAVRPSGSSSAGGKWRRGEAAGCGIGFYSGGGAGYANCDWTGVVERNAEGSTKTSGGTTKRPTFHLEKTDGATSTTPNVAIWPRRHLLVIHASGYSRAIRGVRVRIKHVAASTFPGRPSEGYYQIGKVAFGSYAVFGFDYTWQREIGLEPNTELTVLDDGTAISRVRGRAGRTVSVNWADGVDLTSWRLDDFPDYVKASANTAAEAVAFWGDVPIWLQDLVRELDGAHLPVVYTPHIPYDSASTSSGDVRAFYDNWAAGAIYGRIVSPVRIEQVVGDEEVQEIYRVTTVELREER